MFIDKYFINELSDKEVEFKLDQIESTLTTLLDINSKSDIYSMFRGICFCRYNSKNVTNKQILNEMLRFVEYFN